MRFCDLITGKTRCGVRPEIGGVVDAALTVS